MDDFNKIPRPVHRSDFLVIFAGFLHNLMRTLETLTAELFELSIYLRYNLKNEIHLIFSHSLDWSILLKL